MNARFFFRNHTTLLFLAGVLFFFVSNYLNFTTPRQFNSPDETMHYVFISEFATKGALSYAQPYPYGEARDLVFPRSTYARDGRIIPVGFWGLNVIYGLIGRLIGVSSAVYATSIFLILAALCWYEIMRKIFSVHVAFASSFFLLFHPAMWYYSARSLFPNVSFLALLVIGSYFFLIRPLHTKTRRDAWWLNDILGSIFLFSSILIRPSEVMWIGIAGCIIAVAYRRAIRWYSVLISLLVGCIFFFIYTAGNAALYQGALVSYVASSSFPWYGWYQIFFPFGIHPFQIVRSVYAYVFRLFWWLTLPGAFGFFWWCRLFFKRQLSKEKSVYLLVASIVSVYLILFYGSFRDARFALETIGIAYVRYWLPVFMLLLPFCFWLIERGVKRFSTPWMRQGIWIWCVIFFLALNTRIVWTGIDGLVANRASMLHAGSVRQWITTHVPQSALIATKTEDKFVWPARQVLVSFDHPDVLRAIRTLLTAGFPVYLLVPEGERSSEFFSRFSQEHIELREEKAFPPHLLFSLRPAS